MSITIKTPAPGVRVLALPDGGERFKTAMLTVQLLMPLAAETASEQAILPFLLRRGCRAYPDFTALKEQLNRLYGAQVTASVGRVGEAQALYLQILCLDDRYALAGEAVAAQCAELLRGMLFEPPFADGVFRAADVEEERRCLIESIRSEINDKRRYARSRCEQILCEGEPFAVNESGTVEGVTALTPAQITAAWRRVLAQAQVTIAYQGSGNGEAVAEPFVRGFSAIERRPAELPVIRRPHEGAVREREERMAVAQSKMVMGLRCSVSAAEQDTPALRMANALFGGTAFAMLFRTVREKLSLCYYCLSSFDRIKGVGLIDSGVEADKIPAARAEILRQFDRLKAGDFTDEDLEDTRRFLISQFYTVEDLQSSRAGFYLSQALSKNVQTPQQAAEEIAAVTRERVVAAANTLAIACEYRLMPNGEAVEEGESHE